MKRKRKITAYLLMFLLLIGSGLNFGVSAADGTPSAPTPPAFDPVQNYGEYSGSFAKGDFNGDGKEDFVTTHENTGQLYYLKGNGDGTFKAPIITPSKEHFQSPCAGDFNKDKRLDLATVYTSVLIQLGNGDGTFDGNITLEDYCAAGSMPSQVVAADVNNDENLDLIVSNFQSHNISVLTGNGDGTFDDDLKPFQAGETPTNIGPSSMAVADYNNDELPDIAVVNYYDESFSILLNRSADGMVDFSSPKVYKLQREGDPYASKNMSAIIAGDIVGNDGILDLAVTAYLKDSSSEGHLYIYKGTGNGKFDETNRLDLNAGRMAGDIALGDFNDDGQKDLAVTSSYTNKVSIFTGMNGEYQWEPSTWGVGSAPLQIIADDFNGDGLDDIATANRYGGISILLQSNGGESAAPVWPAGSTFTASNVTPYSADLNWTAATDDTAVTGYQIYDGGDLLADVAGTQTSCTLSQLQPEQIYNLTIKAYDSSGNVSVGPNLTFSTLQGVVWNKIESGTQYTLRGVAYGNGTYVVVGDGGTVLTSTDGDSWTKRSLAGEPVTANLYSVVFAQDMFVVVGQGGVIYSSGDGVSWSAQSSGTNQELLSVAYGNGNFIATGRDAIYTVSPDVTLWQPGCLAETSEDVWGVAYGEGVFAAVDTGGKCYTSADLGTWNRGDTKFAPLFGITYGDGQFLAIGGNNSGSEPYTSIALTSDDAKDWDNQNTTSGYELRNGIFGDGGYVAVGYGVTLYSEDAASWNQIPTVLLNDVLLYGAGFGNHCYIAVGSNGTILKSGTTGSITDDEAVAAAGAALTFDVIKVKNDLPGNILTNLNLITAGLHGTAISWSGSDPFIGSDGNVTRPSYDQGDRTVKLIATITKGDARIQKEFDLVVKALTQSDDKDHDSSHSNNKTADLTVTFKANDGTDKTVTQKSVKTNGTVTLPEEPDRDGYTFIGWNKKTNGAGYTFTAMTEVTQSLVVYAQWEKNENAEVAQTSRYFSDMADAKWAIHDIDLLHEKEVVYGVGDNLFKPNSSITRADFMTMLVRAYGLNVEFSDNFTDVSQGKYYYEAVGIAKELGIAKGDGALFRPNDPITRQEAMTLAQRTLDTIGFSLDPGTETDLAGFADAASVASYARIPVATLIKSGIVIGEDNMILPLDQTTRAEMSAILYRMLNLK